MENQLTRTVSTESTVWQPLSGRKARASEPETAAVDVKLPPPAMRRSSRASESILEYFTGRHTGSAIDEDDVDTTPLAAVRNPLALSEARGRSDVEAENRLSFSSLCSIGSAIYTHTRPSWSARNSLVGSELEGATAWPYNCQLLAGTLTHDSKNGRPDPT
jgi:hypothetical protein